MKTNATDKDLWALIALNLAAPYGARQGAQRVNTEMSKDGAQLFKQFQDNDSFRRRLTETISGITYET